MHSIFHLKFVRTPWCSLWFVYVNKKIMWSRYSYTHPHICISSSHANVTRCLPKIRVYTGHWITSYFTNYICLLTLQHFCLFSIYPSRTVFCFCFYRSHPKDEMRSTDGWILCWAFHAIAFLVFLSFPWWLDSFFCLHFVKWIVYILN